MPREQESARRGFALPLVIAILAVGGILVTASFLLGRLESQSSASGVRAARVLEAAETGLASSGAQWNPWIDSLPVGGETVLDAAAVATASWQTMVRRLGDDLFLIRSEASLPIAGVSWQGTRRLARLLRWAPVLPPPAALTVIDSVTWSGAGAVSGYSASPAGWPSCGADSAQPIRVLMAGSPAAAIAPLLYDSLAARATHTPLGSVASVGPSLTGSPPACNALDPFNWGDPDHGSPAPCTMLFPVVHASGDLSIGSGKGQGIILVDGNLTVGGGFQFAGLVVVRGRLLTQPGGASLTGSVFAQTVDVPTFHQLTIDYSACVLRKVLRGPSQAIPLLYRSWAQLY